MKKRLLISSALVVVTTSLALAAQATAGTTTVSVSMSFTEPIVQNVRSGCPVLPDGFCCNGVVVHVGHATETIQFGGACGGNCDFRTVNVAGGSIYMDGFEGGGTCPGSCQSQPSRAWFRYRHGCGRRRNRDVCRRDRESDRIGDVCGSCERDQAFGNDRARDLSDEAGRLRCASAPLPFQELARTQRRAAHRHERGSGLRTTEHAKN
jgi:hypothetical protein